MKNQQCPTDFHRQKFLNEISATPQFLAARKGEQYPGQNIPRAAKIGAEALARLNTAESGYKSPDAAVYTLISTIDGFASSVHTLDRLQAHNASSEEKYKHKVNVLHFNHAIKEVIDTHPKATPDELTAFVIDMYSASHHNQHSDIREWEKERDTLRDYVEQHIYGMQHEILGEQIIELTEGVEAYDPEVSINEEMKGIDGKVTMHGHTFVIDIKGSENAVIKSRQSEWHNPDKYIHSCVTPSEAKKYGFRLPYEVAVQKSAEIQTQLEEAYRGSLRSANVR